MKTKVYDESMSLRGSLVSRIKITPEGWTDGEVLTPHGIVSVYAQGDDLHHYSSRLDYVVNGRLHMRNFNNVRLTPRGLATAARKFAAEVNR